MQNNKRIKYQKYKYIYVWRDIADFMERLLKIIFRDNIDQEIKIIFNKNKFIYEEEKERNMGWHKSNENYILLTISFREEGLSYFWE